MSAVSALSAMCFLDEAAREGLAASKLSKVGAEKLTPEEQRRRFIEAALESGASENGAEFDKALGRLVKEAGGSDYLGS